MKCDICVGHTDDAVLHVTCDECLQEQLAIEERATADLRAEIKQLTLGLRNVRALAKRMRKTDPTNAGHLLRFCDDAGIVDSILRGGAR